ncbi:hypothetical protein Pfo_003691 [Paulownia fortunei]|nr:hypothetical protein Pfo_003691 [Paulownia fortunei]
MMCSCPDMAIIILGEFEEKKKNSTGFSQNLCLQRIQVFSFSNSAQDCRVILPLSFLIGRSNLEGVLQIVMNSQVTGRYQRARGLKLKRALQFVTLLAICIWLLYQIIHPHDKSSPTKISEQHSILGRKVNMGWLTRKNESDAEGGKFVDESRNWEGGAGDDQLTKSQQEKANGYLEEISVLADDKDDQIHFEMQRMVLHGGSDGDGVASLNKERREKDSFSEGYQNLLESFMHRSQENIHKEAEVDGKKPEVDAETAIKGKDVTVVLNKTGEHNLALDLEDNDAVFPNRIDNPWQRGTENGLRGSGFDDENGVPLGLNDITESKGTE